MAAPQWQEQFGFILQAIGQGESGAATLRTLRDEGLGIRTQQFYRLWATGRSIAAEAGQEPTRPLDQAPMLTEAPPVATRAAEGFLQTTRLVYRERVTGNQRVVFHSVKTDTPLSRQEVIDQAIEAYQGHSDEYETDLVAAVYTSTIHLVPVGEAA